MLFELTPPHVLLPLQNRTEHLRSISLPFLAALAALYLPLWVSETFENWDPSDIWSEWFLDKKTNGQNAKKTKQPEDKKTKYSAKGKDQKEIVMLWCHGSFALLQCFSHVGSYQQHLSFLNIQIEWREIWNQFMNMDSIMQFCSIIFSVIFFFFFK